MTRQKTAAQVLRMRQAGKTYREIAAKLDTSESNVVKIYKEGMPPASVDFLDNAKMPDAQRVRLGNTLLRHERLRKNFKATPEHIAGMGPKKLSLVSQMGPRAIILIARALEAGGYIPDADEWLEGE